MFPFVWSGCGQDTVMLLAARLTWCTTGTAEGTELQGGGVTGGMGVSGSRYSLGKELRQWVLGWLVGAKAWGRGF
jgi:hypothetical protein